MRRSFFVVALLLLALAAATRASAFCGFYVAKADASLYNQASQVVLVRDGNRMAFTLLNDYRGELSDFALVVPVPEVLTREQINVGDKALVDRVDAYSAPRLVEYFDPDPCEMRLQEDMAAQGMNRAGAPMAGSPAGEHSLGVTIEARYTIGEYDILILSAKESGGLETWLKQNGYKMPNGASKALAPYIKQSMKFFVAKVNLKEQAKTGFTYLRPLQFAFESPKFMLPIRLGMVNAQGPQDLLVYAITRKGRVETTNYRNVKLPTDADVPLFVKDEFVGFYKAMFDTVYKKENKRVVFQEYGWNMGWCDPCAADPLTAAELRKLGVFWIPEASSYPGAGGGAVEAYLTRLHVRYDKEHFPEDLFFQTTADTDNFQGRYVLNHPWEGSSTCSQVAAYRKSLPVRRQKEANTLASLTGWEMAAIYKKMGGDPSKGTPATSGKWYQTIFK